MTGKTSADAFFVPGRPWEHEAAVLRGILLSSGLGEEVKWRAPCYTHGGSNIAMLARLKDYCAVGFFKGVLLDDPDGLLTAPGPNSQSVRQLRVTSVQEAGQHEAALRGFIRQAIANEEAGRTVAFRKEEPDYPEEMLAAFEADPELHEAFMALTPGRRRGYALHVGQAKQSATRAARIAKHRARILSGKGMHDR